jgi:hypothetical protein
VPGNGLAFPVRVSGQKDIIGALGRGFKGLDHFLLAAYGHILGRKILFNVNAEIPLRKVQDMAHGGSHVIGFSHIFVKGFYLCGRFND